MKGIVYINPVKFTKAGGGKHSNMTEPLRALFLLGTKRAPKIGQSYIPFNTAIGSLNQN